MLSVLARSIRLRGKTRPDLSPDCPEKLPELQFLRFIWGYPTDYRPDVLAHLANFESAGGRVVRLRSRRAANAFLAQRLGR